MDRLERLAAKDAIEVRDSAAKRAEYNACMAIFHEQKWFPPELDGSDDDPDPIRINRDGDQLAAGLDPNKIE